MSHRILSAAAAMFIAAPSFAQTPAAAAQPIPAPSPEIEVGRVAPDFTMPVAGADGVSSPVTLTELRGKVVVLAFYPQDRSGGCTHQLTKFRDEHEKIFGSGTVVLPISVDSLSTHASWAAEMKFPFVLGSDPELSLAKTYGSFDPNRRYSRRTVFVIGKDGRILFRNLAFAALNENAYTELAAEVAKAHN